MQGFPLVRRYFFAAFGVMMCMAHLVSAQAQIKEADRTGGPYVPTPQAVVDQMLRFGRVGANDFVMDLGSGDGVIVLTAARQLKASGMGIEIDPELVQRSNDAAKKFGVADRATFQAQDVFKADLSRATVVTLYLLPAMMVNLRNKIYNELRPGTRVVSHDYHFGDWEADDRITFDVPEKEPINGTPSATLYLWTIPAKVTGRWQIKVDGNEAARDIDLTQNLHTVNGTLPNAKGMGLSDVSVKGEDITFSIWNGGARHHYRGKVKGNAMGGVVNLDGKEAKWQAVRALQK
ncbi:MAG: methyltransferase domain-containing protein [Burkholderiales bacterium]